MQYSTCWENFFRYEHCEYVVKEKSSETVRATLVIWQNCVMECDKFVISYWKAQICWVRLLHLRNIHGTIVVKYSPPHSLHKFLYGLCHWRIMVSSIYLCNKTFFTILLFHEYIILHNPRPVFAIPMSRFCFKEIWSAYFIVCYLRLDGPTDREATGRGGSKPNKYFSILSIYAKKTVLHSLMSEFNNLGYAISYKGKWMKNTN
jgi:hypothetical protein